MIRLVLVALIVSAVSAARANEWIDLNNNGAGRKDGHMMAYDSQSGVVVLFGDHTNSFDGETWVYDPVVNVWSAMAPPAPPSPRSHGAMVYDVQSDRAILYGGQWQDSSGIAETWAYDVDSNSWTNRNPPGASPGGRRHHAMAYDAQSDRVILYGGAPGLADTWAYEFEANRWTQRAGGPPALQRHAMAYDSSRDRVLMVGLGQTWSYDYTSDQWTRLNTSAPNLAAGAATPEMAYDVQSDRTILINDDSVTWAFDYAANQWTDMNPPTAPIVHHFDMVYVDAVDRIILYGGRSGGSPDETWAYSLDDGGGGTDPVPPSPPTGLSVY